MSIRLYNSSGGYIDLESGGTSAAANVFTLPAETGTILTSATAASSIPGNGALIEADQWRISADTNLNSGNQVITSNWERVDTDGGGYIGTGMSQSSGVFTFPSTGIWLIRFIASFDGANSLTYAGGRIYTTLDNSTYGEAAAGAFAGKAANAYCVCVNEFMFDVTNTTNCKVRFQAEVQQSCSLRGDTTDNRSVATFIRLGDT